MQLRFSADVLNRKILEDAASACILSVLLLAGTLVHVSVIYSNKTMSTHRASVRRLGDAESG